MILKVNFTTIFKLNYLTTDKLNQLDILSEFIIPFLLFNQIHVLRYELYICEKKVMNSDIPICFFSNSLEER